MDAAGVGRVVARWSRETGRRLTGVGLDVERIDRFRRIPGERERWLRIYSPAELEHALALPDPARGLCAAFACKEALFKAAGERFDLATCQSFYQPGVETCRVILPVSFAGRGLEAVVSVQDPAPGELAVTLLLLAPLPSPAEVV
jgi:hypothetical protein